MPDINNGALSFTSSMDNDQMIAAIDETLRRIQGLSDGTVEGTMQMSEAFSATAAGVRRALDAIDDATQQHESELERLRGEYSQLGQERTKAFTEGREEEMRSVQESMDKVRGEIAVREELVRELEDVGKQLKAESQALSGNVQMVDKDANAHQSLKARMKELKDQMAELRLKGIDEQSEAYRRLRDELGMLADIQGDIATQGRILSNDDAQFQGIITGAQGATAAISLLTGAYGLFGEENKELQQIMLKVQSLMAITQGMQQVSQVLNKDSAFMLTTIGGLKQWWAGVLAKSTAAEIADTEATEANTIAHERNAAATTANSNATENDTAITKVGTIATEANTAATSANTAATEANTVAEGAKVNATNAGTSATSANTVATDANTVAEGANINATTADTTATSANTVATEANTIAEGLNTNAIITDTTATSANTIATDANTIAEGANTSSTSANTIATSANTIAEGANTTGASANTAATEANTIAEGINTTATSANTIATDANTTAEGANATATNVSTSAIDANTTAEGLNANATNVDTSAISANTAATSANTIAEGENTLATSANTLTTDANAIAEDASTKNISANTIAVETNTLAEGANASAITENTIATEANAIAAEANAAATKVSTSATEANTLSEGANMSAILADTTATTANTAAIEANAVATEADTAATSLGTSVTETNTAATSANTIATDANALAENAKANATNAETTATTANTIAIEGNTVAEGANIGVTNADTSARSANTAAIEINTMAEGANTSAMSANAVAIKANSIAEDVHTSNTTANTVAIETNTIAEGANTSAVSVNTGIIEANTLAEETNVASVNVSTTAIDANTLAKDANATAISAQTSANSASTLATEAKTLATEANTAATEANTAATEINAYATEASTLSTETDTSATAVGTAVTEANTVATEANTVATEENTVAEGANANATNVESTAKTANTTATEANTAAQETNAASRAKNITQTSAQTTAENAQTAAATAGTAANKGLAGAFRMVGTAIKSIPVFGWIIAGIAALVAVLVHFKNKADEAKKAALEFGNKVAEAAYKPIGNIQRLSMEWNELGDNLEAKEKFIRENKKAFEDLGVAVDNVTAAENILVLNKDKFIQAQIAKAKSTILVEQAMQKLREAMEKKNERDQESSTVTKLGWKGWYNPWKEKNEEMKQRQEEADDLFRQAREAEEEHWNALNEIGAEGVNTYDKGTIGALEQMMAEKQAALKKLADPKEYAEAAKEIEELQKQIDAITGAKTKTTSTTSKVKKTPEEERAERFKKALDDMRSEYSRFNRWMNSGDAILVQTAQTEFQDLISQGSSYIDYLKKQRDQILAISSEQRTVEQKEWLVMVNNQIAEETKQTVLESFTKELNTQLEQAKTLSEMLDVIEERRKELANDNSELDTSKADVLDEAKRNVLEQAKTDYEAMLREYGTFEEKKQRIIDEFEAKRVIARQNNNEALVESLNDAQAEAISELAKTELMDSGLWEDLFGNLDELTTSQIQTIVDEIERQFDTLSGVFNPVDLKAVRDKLNEAKDIIEKDNPFKQMGIYIGEVFKDAGDDSKQSAETIKRNWKKLGDATEASFQFVMDAVNSCDFLKEAIGDVGATAISSMQTCAMTAIAVATAIKTAEKASVVLAIIQAALVVVQAVANVVKSILGNKDAQIEKQIGKWKDAVDNLKNAYNQLTWEIDKALGGSVYKHQKQAIANMKEQQRYLLQMQQAEASKKKTDESKLREYREQYAQLERDIADMMDEISNDILQTNAKDFASQLGDALADAFGKGEDAAKALESTVNEVMKNAILNQLKKNFLEQQLQGTLDELEKSMGTWVGDSFHFDGLSDAEIQSFRNRVQAIADNYNEALKQYSDIFKGITEEDESSLVGAVKGVTEDTAEIISGQMQAIRINQAENLAVMRNAIETLERIAHNTSYNHHLTKLERILNLMEANNHSDAALRANGIQM